MYNYTETVYAYTMVDRVYGTISIVVVVVIHMMIISIIMTIINTEER